MSLDDRIVIIGSGIAGLNIAWTLNRQGYNHVTLVEKEPHTMMKASGLNTGKIRHYHEDPEIRRELKKSITLLEQFQEDQSESFFELTSSLWLFGSSPRSHQVIEGNQDLEWKEMNRNEVPDLFKTRNISEPCWGEFPRDGLLDAIELGTVLRRHLEHSDVEIKTGTELIHGDFTAGRWVLKFDGGTQQTSDILVNAAGVWANQVADRVGVEKADFHPVRRKIFYIPKRILPDEYGYYWDHVNEYYFRKVPGGTMISYCEDHPVESDDIDQIDDPLKVLKKEIGECYPEIEIPEVEQYWSGQFARTKDRKPILKRAEDLPNLIWASGFNDYGMSLSFRIGQRVRELLESE